MLQLLQRWAKDNECDGIEATARLGWSKIFKSGRPQTAMADF